MKELFTHKDISETNLKKTADLISSYLTDLSYFCLWLEGNLGAGKTTVTKYILQRLGLNKKESVTSPTFTYINTYKIKHNNYAHIDLYRNPKIPIKTIIDEDFDGIFIEWPQCLENNIYFTHKLEIKKSQERLTRDYMFFQL